MADNREERTNQGQQTSVGSGVKSDWAGLFKEVIVNSDIKKIVAIWAMTVGTVVGATALAAGKLQEIIENDPNATALRHEQRSELIGLLTENAQGTLEGLQRALSSVIQEVKEGADAVLLQFKRWDAQDRAKGKQLVDEANARFANSKHFKWLRIPGPAEASEVSGR